MTQSTAQTADQLLDLRRANSARCADVIRLDEPATISEIADRTGLSRPTVRARLQDLVDSGLVREIGARATSGAGRPASRFAFLPDAHMVAGLELAQYSERLVFADLGGRVLWRGEREAPELDADDRLRSVAHWLQEAAGEVRGAGSLARVGVSVPGAINTGGSFVDAAAFGDWKGRPVAPIVQAAFPVPVDVVHDLSAAMIAERRMGSAAAIDTFVAPVLWHEVSAGIVIGGSVYTGPHGEAGRPHIMPEFRASAVQREEWPDVHRVLALAGAADAGDAGAIASIERFAGRAAEQIAMLQLVVDPEMVVLYGALTASDYLVESVRSALSRLVDKTRPVVLSEFGLDATVLGCTLIALDHAGESLIGPGLRDVALDTEALVRDGSTRSAAAAAAAH